MTTLFLTIVRLRLGKALVAQFAATWFRWLFFKIAGRPIGTIPAPMPSISVIAFAVGHDCPPLLRKDAHYANSAILASGGLHGGTPLASGFRARWNNEEIFQCIWQEHWLAILINWNFLASERSTKHYGSAETLAKTSCPD